MNKIFYNPTTQYENTGDLLINKTLLSYLKKHGKIIVDDNNKPKRFVDELLDDEDLRLSSITKSDSLNYLVKYLMLNLIRSKKDTFRYFVVFVPGHFAKKGIANAIGSIKTLIKLVALKVLGCRLIRIGISVGKYDKINAFIEALITRCYHSYAVRDQDSIINAKKYSFKTPQYFPDFAWGYNHTITNSRYDYYPFDNKKIIVMSFRANEVGLELENKFFQELLESLTTLLDSNIFREHKIVFCYQVDSDRSANLDLCNALSLKFNSIEFFDSKLYLENAFHLYSSAEIVITNRLHVLLLAIKGGTLSFPLIDEKVNGKIYNIMRDNDLLNLVLNIKDSSSDNQSKIVSNLKVKSLILSKLEEVIITNTEVIVNKIKLIFQ